MRIELGRNSKLMIVSAILVLAILICSGASGCDPLGCEKTKEDDFPGFWVACVDNKPTLMSYNGNSPVSITSSPAGNFNPGDFDCSHSGSPQYKGSETEAPYLSSSPAGPGGFFVGPRPLEVSSPGAAQPRAAGNNTVGYLPQLFRDLPFLPAGMLAPAACDPSFPDIFQTVHTNAQVTRISTCPFQIKARIPVVSRPLQIAITPDGATALVTSFDNAVNFIDLATNKVTTTLITSDSVNPNGLAISPDGTKAYITSFDPDDPVVQVIDMATRKIVATFSTTLQYPQGATLSPDGSQLWITGPLDIGVDVFDTLTNTLTMQLNLPFTTDVAFNSTGTTAYVTSGVNGKGTVYAIDTATLQTKATYTVGGGPADIRMLFGDTLLVVNNSLDGSESVIRLSTGAVSTVKLGSAVSGIAVVK
ncbi:MAG TPA: YncE family protein [Bryobacteraceae bacterium]|jgi:YVTN family beta-propeller protein